MGYSREYRYDPTKTLTLRSQFVREVNRRFGELKTAIRRAIINQDVFGLKTNEISLPGERAFAFDRDPDKVDDFMRWLENQQEAGLLAFYHFDQLGVGIEQAWTAKYIFSAYQRGIARARQESIRAGYSVPSIEDSGGIAAIFNQPFHIDRAGLLYTRVFSELKGITSAMDQQISRVLTQGIIDGLNPNQMAKQLTERVDAIGISRARTMARTEVIRAHHTAMVQEYRNWGVEGVRVMAEWVTAGDGRVCPLCAPMDGKVFTIDQIENMIPAHPNCFLDPQTLIYTSNGWKPIGKIVIGDLVLTHKGRFRRVYALPRNKGLEGTTKYTRFHIQGMENGGVSVTSNHPVQVTKEGSSLCRWKEAGDVTMDEQLCLLANKCARCGKLTPFFNKYCSRSCLSQDITDKQWADPKHRQNMSKKARAQIKREYANGTRDKNSITKAANARMRELGAQGRCPLQRKDVRELIRKATNTPEIRKASSERMLKNNPMSDPATRKKARESLLDLYKNHPEKRLNARMAKFRKSGRKTDIEKKMAKLLNKMGVDYVFQYPILKYNADFAIPALNIVIECDGDYWHSSPEAKARDAIRQKRIEKEGWLVLRYLGSRINKCLNEIEQELSRVVLNHTGQYEFVPVSIKKIEHRVLGKNRPLYNLSVEEDESYVAKGMVVHNCRCISIPVDVTDEEE
jgi:SPP1 gp7 family putative phage head morphogenesis protein